MNNFYPINLDLTKINILIIGLGKVGYRKLMQIEKAKSIKIVSKEITDDKIKYLKECNIPYEIREYEQCDLNNIDMILACTDDIYVQKQIKKDVDALNRFVLINYCKLREYSNYTNMSTIQKDGYGIAISTYKLEPSKAKKIRKQLEEKL